MPKARVYDLAKELGVDSKTVLEKLKEMGEFVKSASSTVEPPVVRRLKAAFPKDGGAPQQNAGAKDHKPAAPKPAAAKPVPAAKPMPAAKPAAPAAHAEKPYAAPKPAAPGPKPAPAAKQSGESGHHGPAPKPGQRQGGHQQSRQQNNGRPSAQGNRQQSQDGARQGGPRPGNNPFSRKQGMHTPTPSDIPRPHPMARPTVENGRGGRGNGRPGQGGGRGGFRGRPGQGSQAKPGQWGQHRPGQGGAGNRPAGGNRFGGNAAGGHQGGAPNNGPARGGGRGRGGAAGAFGRQGGKSSKARKNRLAKRQEFQELKAPTIGGVRIPAGNGQTIRLRQGASLADLAEKINVNPAALVTVLFHLGEMATATQSLDESTFQILGEEIGWNIKIVSAEEEDKELLQQFDIDLDEEELQEDEDLKPRPPVVTVMGHVDHGKTRLLDTIRRTNVIAGEAGGITQRIGAYQVTVSLEGEQRKITFLDTPGHEAFTAMRARGAELTDVAILVVAADDGVMPQTVEAINHAQAAHVPIVVAVNKIDVPGANPEKVRGQLTEFGLVPEEYGGDTMFVDISAKQGTNVDKLLEAVLLTADAELDLRANPDMDARGATVEARLDKGRGAVATVLVQQGTLHVGDAIVAGTSYGRVRAMLDENGNQMKEAVPSTPVQVLGLTSVPTAGDLFLVAPDDRTARQIAEKRQATERAAQLAKRRKIVSLESLKEQFAKSEVDMLNIVIKFGNIAGVMVQDGEVKRGTKCRILRNGVATVNDLEISSLRRFKDDVTSVKEGYEAGINLGSFNDIEIGDIIETFEMQEVERK